MKAGRCIPCHVGCTGVLFDEIDGLGLSIDSSNITVEFILPWQKIQSMDEEMAQLVQIGSIQVAPEDDFIKDFAQNVSELQKWGQSIEDTWDLVARRAKKAHEEDKEAKVQANSLAEDMQGELEEVQTYIEDILGDILGR